MATGGLRQFTVSHLMAAVAAVLVSYGSSAVIVFQAAQAFGATDAQINSWFTALALVCGILTFGLSRRFRAPVMFAWCTPGAALMAGMSGIPLSHAVAAFMAAGGLMLLVSMTGWFDRLVRLIPPTLASAMLAGVLLNFGSRVFVAMQQQVWLVACMLAAYFLCKIRFPRYSILMLLLTGFAYAGAAGLLHIEKITPSRPLLQWVTPEFHFGHMISVGLPLFIAALATQNVPGMAVLRAYGYQNVPAKPLINLSSGATVLGAPFGVFMVNLAAISAAVCMGSDVDKDPNRRYLACLLFGGLYGVMALCGGMVVSLFAALPPALLAALAGIAIFGTLQANLVIAWQEEQTREASLVTLLASASGMMLFGIGSAFWGILLGLVVYHLNRKTSVK